MGAVTSAIGSACGRPHEFLHFHHLCFDRIGLHFDLLAPGVVFSQCGRRWSLGGDRDADRLGRDPPALVLQLAHEPSRQDVAVLDQNRPCDVLVPLRRQSVRAFHAISAKKAAKMIVAYEPVWAIGTGKTATPELAAEAHAVIRREATEIFGEEFAGKLRILYGGSVKPENASALMSQEEIDGALVGGASLDPKSFAAIVKY